MTSRHYCFTYWDVSKNLIEMINSPDGVKNVRYMVYQKEMCPATQKLHYQGYIELKNAIRGTQLQKILGSPNSKENPSACHFSERRGTRDEARNYCMKQDTRVEGPWEFGNYSGGGQGKRNDIRRMYDLIKEGKNDVVLQEQDPACYARHYKAFDRMRANILREETKKKFRKLKVVALVGDAGTGKTRHVMDKHGYAKGDVYTLPANDDSLWWDGYAGEKILLIDEFYGGIKYGTLLKILDGYDMRLPIKGGFTYANWEKVYITSNKQPHEWYSFGSTPALNRRITKIRHFKSADTELNAELTKKCDINEFDVESLKPLLGISNAFSQPETQGVTEWGVIEGPPLLISAPVSDETLSPVEDDTPKISISDELLEHLELSSESEEDNIDDFQIIYTGNVEHKCERLQICYYCKYSSSTKEETICKHI